MHPELLFIPDGAETLLQILHDTGYSAYLVGGCVRDILLGKLPHDWDICTSATPEQMQKVFQGLRVIETGLKHGTLTVMMSGEAYEVTTFRVDGTYSDGRHPDQVEFVTDVTQDLARRDFTINAMAYTLNDEKIEIIDPFDGQSDLESGIIKAVGNPVERFMEDGLRILRALRFASTYRFKIDEPTAQAIHVLRSLLKNISAERIREELIKLLKGLDACRILEEYPDVICEIIPEMIPCIGFVQNNPYHCFNVYDHIAHAVGHYLGGDPVINMALLLHDIGKPKCYTESNGVGHFHGHGEISADLAEEILDRLKFDTKSKNDIDELIRYHDLFIEPNRRAVRRMLNRLSRPELFSALMDIRLADICAQSTLDRDIRMNKRNLLYKMAQDIIQENQCFQMKDLSINGLDIMKVFNVEGKQIGSAKNFCLNAVMDEQVENEKEKLIQYLREHMEDWVR